jgi:hypothetical protein
MAGGCAFLVVPLNGDNKPAVILMVLLAAASAVPWSQLLFSLRTLQFSLRALLITTTVVAVLLGLIVAILR